MLPSFPRSLLGVLLFTAMLAPPPAQERPLDRVLLRDGRQIEAHVLLDNGFEVRCQIGRKRTSFERSLVSEVISSIDLLREYSQRARSAESEGSDGLLSLMAWCTEVGLQREAKLVAWRLLLFDPEQFAAHGLLGSERKQDRWRIAWGDNRYYFEDWSAELDLRWERAAEIETSLYWIRSNASPSRTLEAATDLVRAHVGWFELFGDALGQEHRVELFEVALHDDERSYPQRVGDPLAYYDAGDDRIEIDTRRSALGREVYHEVAHQCLAEFARQHKTEPSVIPAWIAEGAAEVVARACQGGRHIDLDPLWLRASEHYGLLAEVEDLPAMSILFSYSSEDYHGAAQPELRYALAYSFVVELLASDNPAMRERFLHFMGELVQGKVDQAGLAKALNLEPDALEQRWHAALRPSSSEPAPDEEQER